MCQIVKMSYNSGSLMIEVSSGGRDLSGCIFKMYSYDFREGRYNSKADIEQKINAGHISHITGNYSFKYNISGNKIKCVIADGEKTLVLSERFVGEKHKINVRREQTEIGCLYEVKSDISVCKNLIFYKSPISSTKINLPADLNAGETLMFTIKEKGFVPNFQTFPEIKDCFDIE